ncbi:MAG: IS1380 family transposase [Candidatus Dormibacteraceae bacterium]
MKRTSPRRPSFTVTTDGLGVVNHAGAAALREFADRFEYTSTLCDGLDPLRARRATHHPGAVLTDLAVSIADGGDCLRDLAVLHDQPDLFGRVASVPTAPRVISRLTRGHLEQVRGARRRMREQVWRKAGRPELLVLDIDATLVTSHSEKEEASGNYKHGFGYHPLTCFLEATGEALAAILRPGRAGSNTAKDHIEVFRLACQQLPEWVQEDPVLVRCDSAGATHDFLKAVRAREKAKFSVGFELREDVREAILSVPEEAWEPAIRQDGEDREGADVCELHHLDLSSWPVGTRALCRRERPHPGRSALLHRSRRVAFPGLHHRPAGRGHRPAGGSPPSSGSL